MAEALRVLAMMQIEPARVAKELMHLLWNGTPTVQAAAAHAVGEVRLDPAIAVPNLAALLRQTNNALGQEASGALSRYGLRAGEAAPQILDALACLYPQANYPVIDSLLIALRETTPDARSAIADRFKHKDKEMCRDLLGMLYELDGRAEG